MAKKVRPLCLNPTFPSPLEQKLIRTKNTILHVLYPLTPFILTFIFGFVTLFQVVTTPLNDGVIATLLASISLWISTVLTLWILLKAYLYFFVFRYKSWIFEGGKNASLWTKVWGISFKLLTRLSPPRLNTCNHLLPRQFVPRLHDTINGYLESVKPLYNKMEFEDIKAQAEDFLKSDGPILQRYAHYLRWTKDNYIKDLWEKYIYLSSREPLLMNFSVGFGDSLRTRKMGMTRRAANHVHVLTCGAIAFFKEDIEPPGEGLCFTGRHTKVFTHTRIPGKEVDYFVDHGLPRHVVILYNGCYYRVDAFDPKTNRVYQPAELEAIFDEIIERKDVPSTTERHLAALTTDRRDKWAENREKFLLSNPVNKRLLDTVESALYFVALDDEEYGDIENDKDATSYYTKVMTLGKGNDRWTDKPLSYHITACGHTGGTFEHSLCDGVEYRTLCEYGTHTESRYVFDNVDVLTEDQRRNLKFAERMEVEVLPGMEAEVMRCYRDAVKRNDDFDLASIMFKEVGKGKIKECKCSPDAFIQMAYQLAYYRLTGRYPLTYEASSALFFSNGRTETIRTLSEQSCGFVESVVNEADVPSIKAELFSACRAHALQSKRVMVGQGIDRHLFVLYILSKYKKVNSDFLDTYAKQKWTLSTSQAPSLAGICEEDTHHDQCFMAGAFGAVDKDGYGITYKFMGNHSIALHVSSYHCSPHTDSGKFLEAILDALREMTSYFDVEIKGLT